MNSLNCKFAVKTAGFGESSDFRWEYNGITADRVDQLEKVIDGNKPGIVVYKNGRDDFDLLLCGIDRKNCTDYRGRPISLKVFIGGLDESAARGIAIAVLEDWSVTAGFAKAFSDADTEQGWQVNFDKIRQTVVNFESAQPVKVFEERWSNTNTPETQQELAQELRKRSLSDTPGFKLYVGGSPHIDYREKLREEVDRYYTPTAKRDRLPPSFSPIKEEMKKVVVNPPQEPDPRPPKPRKKNIMEMPKVYLLLAISVTLALIIGAMTCGTIKNSTIRKMETQMQTMQNSLESLKKENDGLRDVLRQEKSFSEALKTENEELKKQLLIPAGGV